MRRRTFIAGLASAAAWPLASIAQHSDHEKRIGALIAYSENDSKGQAFLSGFTQRLEQLGWTKGRNLKMEVRWAAGDVDQMRTFAKELVDLQPDVILAHTTPVTASLQLETRTIPIVFVTVSDPVGSGFVASLSRPTGNLTGFINQDARIGGKWLELLKEIAPSVKRVGIIFNPDTAARGGEYYLSSFETAASAFKMEAIRTPVHDDGEIEKVMTSLGREPGTGIVAMSDGFVFTHRAPIISLAARNKLPAVYGAGSELVKDGGLLSYGADEGDIFIRAAPYIDRLLKGEKPTELPVQLPIKFEMALNVKTAKALGLAVPPSILLRADEVIE